MPSTNEPMNAVIRQGGATVFAGFIPNVKKIAVLRSNSLGDYIFALPALDALRVAYPAAEIVLLGKPWHASFLKGRPGPVDRVAVVPYTQGVCMEAGAWQESSNDAKKDFFRRMAGENFDIAFQMYGGGRYSNPFVRQLGAAVTIGMKADDALPLDRWVPYVFYHPEILRYLEVVALAGVCPSYLEPRLSVTGADRAEVQLLRGNSSRPVVVLHPGGTDSRRLWQPAKFAVVGDALAAAGTRVIVTGTTGEETLAAAILRAMKMPGENWCGMLSLGGLAGLLAEASLVVSSDTGPLHLARAVGTSTVGIYWVGNFINAGPVRVQRHRSHLSWRLDCPQCGLDCTRGKCSHTASFVADVSADEVAASAIGLLQERSVPG